MSTFKPLLAVQAELESIDFSQGLVASPKLDGIRAIVIDGVVMSRSLKPIPNKYVQYLFGRPELEHLDGELILGDPTSASCYRDTNSACMKVSGEPDVTFYVFDHIENPQDEYCRRLISAQTSATRCPFNATKALPQVGVANLSELQALEESWLAEGYEGLMLWTLQGPNSKYKFGRATAKSQTLLKIKRFVDHEYKVVGFVERMRNENEATIDALGHTKRSTHQENKVGRGDLGALILETSDGLQFNCGTGFDDALRAEIWGNQGTYLGQFAKVKSFLIGVKDAPRFPVFLGFRPKEDMS